MSEAGILTLTCPHCTKRVYAKSADAGRRVRCPHLECRKAVPVPLPMDDEDEPEEAVLIPEDPAAPQQAPVAPAAVRPRAKPVPTSAPGHRREPRRDEEDDEPKARGVVLLSALAVVAFLAAFGAGAVTVLTVTSDKPAARDAAERGAAVEATNRALREENQKLRDQLAAAESVAPRAVPPAPKEPELPVAPREVRHEIRVELFYELLEAGQLRSLTLYDDRATGEVRDPAYQGVQGLVGVNGLFVVNLPAGTDPGALAGRVLRADARYRSSMVRKGRPEPESVHIVRFDQQGKAPDPARPDPAAKQPEGRDAFVGKWSVESPELKKQGLEIDMTVEFRDDGTCRVEARVAGSVQDLNGKWRWEDRRLRVEMDQAPDAGKPAEVKWNGPDEFTMTGAGDNMTATFRRKK